MSDQICTKDKTLHIEDMQSTVFKGLLHFMYNDSLPAMDDLNGDESDEMAKHPLVAADSPTKDHHRSATNHGGD
ncbi:hypothetical protein PR202_gb25533 [Eleusine coracana subsp. coracana]|uniref:BTB domain-containing protein n=1 Tax=Eleusine coracana subsp. coracana TaxID=191504 RepID=A0AAV5FPH9_ELECO|nr:hypothetical protein PR202_gb25533 [Eleusine coracana subsp. coracana]